MESKELKIQIAQAKIAHEEAKVAHQKSEAALTAAYTALHDLERQLDALQAKELTNAIPTATQAEVLRFLENASGILYLGLYGTRSYVQGAGYMRLTKSTAYVLIQSSWVTHVGRSYDSEKYTINDDGRQALLRYDMRATISRDNS